MSATLSPTVNDAARVFGLLVPGSSPGECVRPGAESIPFFNPAPEIDRLQASLLRRGRNEDLSHE